MSAPGFGWDWIEGAPPGYKVEGISGVRWAKASDRAEYAASDDDGQSWKSITEAIEARWVLVDPDYRMVRIFSPPLFSQVERSPSDPPRACFGYVHQVYEVETAAGVEQTLVFAPFNLTMESSREGMTIRANPPLRRPVNHCDHCGRFDVEEVVARSIEEAIEVGLYLLCPDPSHVL